MLTTLSRRQSRQTSTPSTRSPGMPWPTSLTPLRPSFRVFLDLTVCSVLSVQRQYVHVRSTAADWLAHWRRCGRLCFTQHVHLVAATLIVPTPPLRRPFPPFNPLYSNYASLRPVIPLRHGSGVLWCSVHVKKEGKGRTLVIAPLQAYQPPQRRSGTWRAFKQRRTYLPLYLPGRSPYGPRRYSFTDPERMEGWVNPGPRCKEQLAHNCYATARSQRDSNLRPRSR